MTLNVSLASHDALGRAHHPRVQAATMSMPAEDRTRQIRILADTRRTDLLRRLLRAPATISQLGAAVGRHPAWVRHHVLRLQTAGLVELCETRQTKGYVEKYYRATADSTTVELLGLTPVDAAPCVVITGSDDPALGLLAEALRHDASSPELLVLPTGSLEGLIGLRHGIGQIAGCHLLDTSSGDFNVPYIRHLLPGRCVVVTTLAHREQGLMVTAGNPLGLTGLQDVITTGALFAHRNEGSGTRIWLEHALQTLQLAPDALRCLPRAATTHHEAARLVAEGQADVAVGLHQAAAANRLAFIPLFWERYDLVTTAEAHRDPHVQRVVHQLTDPEFVGQVAALPGYNATYTGASMEVQC